MTKRNILIIVLCSLCGTTYSQTNKQILELFNTFQDGYTRRDTSLVNKFANNVCTKDIQILGTGEDEWFQGITSAKNFFRNDWLYWFSLDLDTSTLSLSITDNTAFFLIKGIASITFPNKEAAYDFAYKRLQQLISTEKTSRTKLLSYSSEASNLIQQIEIGSLEIKYSIRISGAIVKQNDKWLFKQLVFSFPYPMTRK
ncbi:hypothetical protein BXY57_0361 [Thermoflavifilum aggregans]|uniref:SnoaL-like protein n=1 Tax=Thermoflavifilum aggregans TaxID=454188 RepID=A0A2M9CSC7_9BACT|nr:hypothetical protein [Thermoflavifilum aggregans]PJJ74799.1 hypothetical protein BXY57_0361 [Thermoflavifilum aggregans]